MYTLRNIKRASKVQSLPLKYDPRFTMSLAEDKSISCVAKIRRSTYEKNHKRSRRLESSALRCSSKMHGAESSFVREKKTKKSHTRVERRNSTSTGKNQIFRLKPSGSGFRRANRRHRIHLFSYLLARRACACMCVCVCTYVRLCISLTGILRSV